MLRSTQDPLGNIQIRIHLFNPRHQRSNIIRIHPLNPRHP